MKGKIFRYDSVTQKMVPVADASMLPLGGFKAEDGTTIGVGLIEIPASQAPQINFTKKERGNLQEILRMAEDHSEKTMDRRDCLRVQAQIARIRDHYGIEE